MDEETETILFKDTDSIFLELIILSFLYPLPLEHIYFEILKSYINLIICNLNKKLLI